MSDNVKEPAHYTQFKFQPLDFIRANKHLLDFMQANVIKYVCRFKLKNGKEDLLKARNYLDMLIEEWDKEHNESAIAILKSLADKPTTTAVVIQRHQRHPCDLCNPEAAPAATPPGCDPIF